jgi:hypothetical protein
MLTRKPWGFVLVALAAGILVIVRPWSDEAPHRGAMRVSPDDVAQQPSAIARGRAGSDAPAPVAAGAPGMPDVARLPSRAIETPIRANNDPMRLQVLAPSDVRVGEVFSVRIDLDATRGVSQVLLTVLFEKSQLALVGWSTGDLARQGSFPAEVVAQEPSDGNIQVSFSVGRGQWVAGAASIVVLEFEAIKAGASEISLRDLTVADGAGTTTRHSVRNASVTIR